MKETFWIDGYNLLFYLVEANPLEKKREALLRDLNELVDRARVEVIVVFDGAKEFHKTSFKALDVIYTPKGMSADDYILEHIESRKRQGHLYLVSNDKFLCRSAKLLKVKTLGIKQFLQFLIKRNKKAAEPERPLKKMVKDREFDRHVKIFEERLKLYEEGKLD